MDKRRFKSITYRVRARYPWDMYFTVRYSIMAAWSYGVFLLSTYSERLLTVLFLKCMEANGKHLFFQR